MSSNINILLFLLVSFYMGAQHPGENAFEEILKDYTASLEDHKMISDCGHVLDAPSYWVKTMENKTLDAIIPAESLDRNEIGKKVYRGIIKSNKISNNNSATARISQIISNLTNQMAHSEKKDFKLTILDTDEINAYSTIGGYIYVTTGLIDFVDSDDELAFILGHEMGHDVLRHTQRKITKLLLSSELLGKVNLENYSNLAMNIGTKFTAPFDQIDEYEADKYGVKLAVRAGYDHNRFSDFFRKIEKNEDRSIISKLSSTHPFAQDRKKCIQKYISN